MFEKAELRLGWGWRLGGGDSAEAEWQKRHSAQPHVKEPHCKHKYRSTLMSYRLTVGKRYKDWRAAAGAVSKTPYADFVREYFQFQGRRVEGSQKEFVKRCAWLAAEKETGKNVTGKGRLHTGVMRNTLVKPASARRRPGLGGPKPKAGFLREALFDWFVDMRSAVACRLPPKFVMHHAEMMADEIIRGMARTGHFIPMPRIDKHWLLRWQRDYCVLGHPGFPALVKPAPHPVGKSKEWGSPAPERGHAAHRAHNTKGTQHTSFKGIISPSK